jgi:DNA-directed RNA polymerase beta subunit
MEKDCIIGHGASRFLKERLYEVSDPFVIWVCKTCGIMTANTKECQMCKGNKIVKQELAYGSKLFFTELMAMGIKIKINSD